MTRRGRAVIALLTLGLIGVVAVPAGAQAEPEPGADDFVIGDDPGEGFEVASPTFVIGPDNRKQVLDTTKNLPRRVVHLLGSSPQGDFSCSGALIAPDVIATAAHCVYNTKSNTFYTNLRAFPGRASGKSKPLGKCTATDADVSQAFKDAPRNRSDAAFLNDYAAIRVTCDQTPTTWFDLFAYDYFTDVGVTLNGYPGDKPFGTQWRAKGQSIGETADFKLVFYDADTFGGTSGGPIYNKELSECTCIITINTLEVTFIDTGQRANAGIQITPEIIDFFDTFEAG